MKAVSIEILYILISMSCSLADNDKIRDGYFVEAGAFDGVRRSNTYRLEKEYGWSGICCEPNEDCKEALKRNRSCILDFGLLYDSDGEEVEFYKADTTGGTLEDFLAEERRLYWRLTVDGVPGTAYSEFSEEDINFIKEEKRLPDAFKERGRVPDVVKTISLNTLLTKHNAPYDIDFFSLDTEGSEFRILSAFDFSKWNVKMWVIEHNRRERVDGAENCERISDLMISKGYKFGHTPSGRDFLFC